MEIKLTVEGFENDKAILKDEENNTIIWPKNKLPKNSEKKSIINFLISNNTDEDNNSNAKNILNEILKNN